MLSTHPPLHQPTTLLSPHGRLLSLQRPQVMGILNLTPDSFFAGSRVASEKDLLTRAEAMLQAGAAVLDLGAYSTRPGAEDISADEETHRLMPAIKALRRAFPEAFLSADTFRASVAEAAVHAGADLVNDVGGGTLDAEMFATVGRLRVPYVLMHLRGTPQTMAKLTHYEDDLVLTLLRYFRDRLAALRQAGAVDVLLDPGFGFAKTAAQSHELLRRLSELRALGLPLLAALSRKRMVYGPLGLGPEAALNGTTALHMVGLQGGARLLRAHDVAEARQTIELFAHTFPNAK
ncbi:dihydropteroate synthase [Hymenobacter properus]|uniref:dihydropteroate synthase n=1 Tax=Hymenobacter properus TaxID=2791026 RepID=A0A931BCD9_9BACT|nr:dihydropteroate synthase [Hymenobacter properus]MBF9141275.1 dihydropteroate synthase [Hymenobacter properus]MBR7720085.1 dihydropteroate synthase [Microvirga sp. SRT04]